MADSVFKGIIEGIDSIVAQAGQQVTGEVGNVVKAAGQQLTGQQKPVTQGEVASLEAKKARDAARSQQKIAQIQASLQSVEGGKQQVRQADAVRAHEQAQAFQKKSGTLPRPNALNTRNTTEAKRGQG